MFVFYFLLFFFNDPAPTEIYTLSHTTLFRSLLLALALSVSVSLAMPADGPAAVLLCASQHRRGAVGGRSEEHTSELQSHSDLVCRLLLEKKKKNKNNKHQLTKTAKTQ